MVVRVEGLGIRTIVYSCTMVIAMLTYTKIIAGALPLTGTLDGDCRKNIIERPFLAVSLLFDGGGLHLNISEWLGVGPDRAAYYHVTIYNKHAEYTNVNRCNKYHNYNCKDIRVKLFDIAILQYV